MYEIYHCFGCFSSQPRGSLASDLGTHLNIVRAEHGRVAWLHPPKDNREMTRSQDPATAGEQICEVQFYAQTP